ncbi:MAG: glycosyltransferase [Clostridium sp.]|uniref:glycosyltransferase n=1 Tax=Clostridium sp. TaxID=1506 RepID=UPI003EE4DF67
MKASVIIPTYNRSYELKLTLKSLVTQDILKENFEVIIVDDGSSDNTCEIIEEFKNILDISYYYQEDKGYRVALARNIGIINSKYEICIFIDNGIILSNSAIRMHLESHKNAYKKSVVLGTIYGFDNFDEKFNIKETIECNNIEQAIKILENNDEKDGREVIFEKVGIDISEWPAPWVTLWSGNFSVEKKVLLKIGLFDENFNSWGGEDTDIGIRLTKNNIKYIYKKNIKSIHYPHEKKSLWITNPKLAMESLMKTKKYLYNKYKSKDLEVWQYTHTNELNNVLINLNNKIKKV